MYFLAPLRCLRGLSSPQHVCLRFNPSCFVASRCRRQPSSQEKKGGWEGGWKRDVGGGLFFLLRNPASGGVQNNKRMGRPGKAGRHGRRKKSEKYRSQAQLEKLRGRRQESVQWSVGRAAGRTVLLLLLLFVVVGPIFLAFLGCPFPLPFVPLSIPLFFFLPSFFLAWPFFHRLPSPLSVSFPFPSLNPLSLSSLLPPLSFSSLRLLLPSSLSHGFVFPLKWKGGMGSESVGSGSQCRFSSTPSAPASSSSSSFGGGGGGSGGRREEEARGSGIVKAEGGRRREEGGCAVVGMRGGGVVGKKKKMWRKERQRWHHLRACLVSPSSLLLLFLLRRPPSILGRPLLRSDL